MLDYLVNVNSCIGINFTLCRDDEETSAGITNATDSPIYLSDSELAVMVVKGMSLGFLVLLTISGNILVLAAVISNFHLRSTTNYFIVNLAVADLLLGTTVLPFSASIEVLGRWSFGQVFCDVWAAVDVLCCTASIISLCVISLDRYIGVTRPLTYSSIMTEKRAIILILLVWATSVAISVGPLFGWKEPPSEDQSVCNVTSQPGYVLFSVSGSFYIPTCVILIVYARIYRAAVQQTRFLERGIKITKTGKGSETSGGSAASSEVTLRVHTGGMGSRHSCDNLTSSPSHCTHVTGAQGRLAKFMRQKKAAKTLGIVVGVFILCWFPFFFVLPLRSFCSSCYVPDTLFQVFFWLGYCNSCLNPIIYAKSSREFKRAFQRLLGCRQSAHRHHHQNRDSSASVWKHISLPMKSTSVSEARHKSRTVRSPENPKLVSYNKSDVRCNLENEQGQCSTGKGNGSAGSCIN